MTSLRFQSVFDIIGPVMIGPSSSHTAGAVRIGKIVSSIFNDEPTEVEFQLFNSFAKTYRGHGTDLALVAGILGMETDDPEIPNSLEIAHKRGIKIVWTIQKDSNAPHPNTTKITVKNDRKAISVTGVQTCALPIWSITILLNRSDNLDTAFMSNFKAVRNLRVICLHA